MKKTNLLLIVLASLLILLARFIPHLPNFSPLASVLLFAGVYTKDKKYLLLPFIALLISDFFIGFYHLGIMLSVYGSFALIAVIGSILKKHLNIINTITSSLAAALFFFLITNLAVWYFGNWYSHNLAGLMLSYTLAIPFFKNTLFSNLLYTGLLFGAYESLKYFYQEKILANNR
jgi:hypothetical protein